MTTHDREFILETLVDFPDDAISAPDPIGETHIDAMMRRLAECGVRRVSWAYHADGRGGFLTPAHDTKSANLTKTYQGLGTRRELFVDRLLIDRRGGLRARRDPERHRQPDPRLRPRRLPGDHRRRNRARRGVERWAGRVATHRPAGPSALRDEGRGFVRF